MELRNPAALLLIPLLAGLGWLIGRQSHSRGPLILRMATVVCIVLALANPVLPGATQVTPLVVLVDQSASLTPEEREAAWSDAQRLAAEAAATRPVRVIGFGAAPALSLDGAAPAVDPSATDVAGALRFASGLLPDGGQVVLLSDGGATTPAAQQAAALLQQRGIMLQAVALPGLDDVRLEALRIPPSLREQEQFTADVVIFAPVAQTIQLEVTRDGAPLISKTQAVPQGRSVVVLQSQATSRGFHAFSATLSAPGDPQPANNSATGWTVVGPPPRVLVVERLPDSAARLRLQLENAGLVTEAIRPAALATSLTQLAVYDSIVLQDIPVSALSLEQQRTLQEFARSLGRGLVVLGGANSFSLGGYADTPLEELLPVSMDPPPRRERAQVALLLIIDRSASMLGTPGSDKLELAKTAALAATESLSTDDTIGVITFETQPDWTVQFTQLDSGATLDDIRQRIAGVQAGGGTNIYGALDLGLPALAVQPAPVRHAVLFTDGRSNTAQSFEALIAPLRNQGLTLSTIAIGNDADAELLESLARLGAGRYHFAATPTDLPRLTLEEAEIARLNPLSEGDFALTLKTPHPAIRGLNVSAMPRIKGYIATTPKPDAERLLTTPDGDVVLASWQYGLGRVIAWTSDANERWSPDWPGWSAAGPFWAQLIAATYPDPQSGPLHATTTVTGATAQVSVDALDASGTPLDLADVALRAIAPDGSEQVLALAQTAPGRYATTLPLPVEGAYQLLISLDSSGQRLELRSGVVRPYAAELAALADPALLAQLAQATGGTLAPDLATALVATAQAQPGRPERALWPWLLLAALLTWLLEIAWRRGWLDFLTRSSIPA